MKITKPVVEIRCVKCRALLVLMDDKMQLMLERDTSRLLDDDWPLSAGDYPQFKCPKHGKRAPFDRIGYHAELDRGGESFEVLV